MEHAQRRAEFEYRAKSMKERLTGAVSAVGHSHPINAIIVKYVLLHVIHSCTRV